MPEALKQGATYVLTNDMGDKTRFIYLGQNASNGHIEVEIDGMRRECEDLTEVAGGHYSAVIEIH